MVRAVVRGFIVTYGTGGRDLDLVHTNDRNVSEISATEWRWGISIAQRAAVRFRPAQMTPRSPSCYEETAVSSREFRVVFECSAVPSRFVNRSILKVIL